MYEAFAFFALGVITTLTVLFILGAKADPLTIHFNRDALQRLENLRVLTEKDNVAKVVSCSIATYEALQLAKKDGKQVALVDHESEEYQEVIVP